MIPLDIIKVIPLSLGELLTSIDAHNPDLNLLPVNPINLPYGRANQSYRPGSVTSLGKTRE